MKPISLILASVFGSLLSNPIIAQDWQWQNPLPQRISNDSLEFHGVNPHPGVDHSSHPKFMQSGLPLGVTGTSSQDVSGGFFGFPVHVSLNGHAGYSFVNMQQINSVIREVGTLRQAVDPSGGAPELLSGGFYWDASLMLRMNRFLVGLGVSSMTTSGQTVYNQAFYLSDELHGRVNEYFLLVGFRIPSEGALFLDLLAGGGYAMAAMDYMGEYRDFFNASNRILRIHTLESGFFSGRVLGVAGMMIEMVNLNVAVGYRFADAGLMKGQYTINGQTSSGDEPFLDFRGHEVKFDYSGVILSAGISVEF